MLVPFSNRTTSYLSAPSTELEIRYLEITNIFTVYTEISTNDQFMIVDDSEVFCNFNNSEIEKFFTNPHSSFTASSITVLLNVSSST